MVLPRANTESKIAFCVSKRTGNAVVRNRIRRKCRASLEPLMDRLPTGWHIAILPGRAWTTMPLENGSQEIIRILQKAGIQLLDPPEKQPGPLLNSTN